MRNKLHLFFFTILLLSFINQRAFSQWENSGPYGGVINALAVSETEVFAGTGNGVFRSSDNGLNWEEANNGIERKAVSALSTAGNKLFAGIYESGIYLSEDKGITWVPKNSGLTNSNISSLFVDSSQLYVGTADGVFFSSNNGDSWVLANNGIPSTYPIYTFVKMGDTIYGGSYGMGLFLTNDNGGTWAIAGGGFPSNSFVYALITDGITIFAATSNGIYKSVNRGINWLPSNTGIPSSIWAKTFAIKPGYILAGTYSEGVFISTNNGNSWAPANNGIPDLPFPTGLPHNYPSVNQISISGINLITATVNGNYLSLNNGLSWMEANHGILATDATTITAAGSFVFAGSKSNGMFRNENNSQLWPRINTGLTSYDIQASTTKGNSVFISTANENVFRSDDNGDTWISASAGLSSDAVILKADSTRVLAITGGATATPSGLFQTPDNGATWTEILTGFTTGMTALALKNMQLFVGTSTGLIYYSNNNGGIWQNLSSGLPNLKINSICITDSIIFTGTEGQGIYSSVNNGATWNTSGNFPTNAIVTDIKQHNDDLYASTFGEGIYISHNMGTSWLPFHSEPFVNFVKYLTYKNEKLYAATEGGIYSYSISTLIETHHEENRLQLFPNPSSGIMHFTVPEKHITLIIYNTSGKIVYSIEGADSNRCMDLSHLSKGTYFASIKSKNKILKQKIIIN